MSNEKKPKEGPIEDIWASQPTVKRKNRAPKPTHIIGGNMKVPQAGSSYNPSKEDRETILNQALEKIKHEELTKANRFPGLALEPSPKEATLADRILTLQEFNAQRTSKVTMNGAAMQQALEECFLENEAISDNESDTDPEAIVRMTPEELAEMRKRKEKQSERKTKRKRNALRRFKEHEHNRKMKLRKKEENKQLAKIPEIIEEFKQEKPKPKKEKKIDLHPKMGPVKYKPSFPTVSLEVELKGNLKDMTPVGNLIKDSYRNIQRRNKLEVRKKISKYVGKKHPKFKVQYVIGGRKGGEVVGRHYEY